MIDYLKRRREAAEEVMALQRMFNTPDGEKALKWFMRECGMVDSSIGEDAHETYFLEGKRAVGLELMQKLKMPYDALVELIKKDME